MNRTLPAALVVALGLTLGAVTPANAGHTTDTSVPTPRSIICKWWPVLCR